MQRYQIYDFILISFDEVIKEINKYSKIDLSTVLVQGKFYLLAGAI